MDIRQILKLVLVSYISCSMLEWVLHAHVMHGNPKTLRKIPLVGATMASTARIHLEHHRAVNMDMTLTSPKDHVHGIIFSWETAFMLFFIHFGLTFALKGFLGMSARRAAGLSLAMTVVYCFLWNNIHMDMHRMEHRIGWETGVPNTPHLLSSGAMYKWLWKYHANHHLQKGGDKGNFNIVLPGFDHLMGTYRGFCFDNTEYCKDSKDDRCNVRSRGCLSDNEVYK